MLFVFRVSWVCPVHFVFRVPLHCVTSSIPKNNKAGGGEFDPCSLTFFFGLCFLFRWDQDAYFLP